MKSPIATVLLALASCAAPAPERVDEQIFYPDPPDPPRVQFLRSIAASADVEPPRSGGLGGLLFGDEAPPPKPLRKPCAIAHRDGVFYVTDTEVGVIYSIDLAARKLDFVPLKGRARLMSPMGLCIGPDGQVYVADRGRRQVVVLNADFSWQRELGPWGDDSTPVDVAVSGDRIVVADSGAGCCRVLDLNTGEERMVLGNAARRAEFMRGPSNVAVDEAGNIYVVDTIYSRIFVWDRDGAFIRHIGAPGDAPGHLARPKGIAYGDRKLWVLDSAFDNCQIFDLDGRTLLFFGGPGREPGCMSLPRKVWVGRAGLELFRDRIDPDFAAEQLVAVTNTYGGKVSFYALGKSKRFEYPAIDLPAQPSKPPPEPAAGAEPEKTGAPRP